MEYSKEVECPSCRRLSKEYAVLAEWTMQSQIVNRVKCAFCKNVFRIYQGEKQDGIPLPWNIPWVLPLS